MAYEVWDRKFANLLGEYDTERAALAVVDRAIRRGNVSADRLAIAHEDMEGETRAIAAGAELAAMAAATRRTRRPAPRGPRRARVGQTAGEPLPVAAGSFRERS